jgi:hypothetical protein
LDPDNVEPKWLAMVYENFAEYKCKPELIVKSVLAQIQVDKSSLFNRKRMPFNDLVQLCDIVSVNAECAEAIAINFNGAPLCKLLLHCKTRTLLLRAAFATDSKHVIWKLLMLLDEETLPADLVPVLKEYNEANRLGHVSIPLSLKDIRSNIELFNFTKDIPSCAKIIKAFAEVDFENWPKFNINYAAIIRYFINNPKMLTVEHFARFLAWVERECVVPGFDNQRDISGLILGTNQ